MTTDVNERIKSQLDAYPVLLYMKGTPDFPQCGFLCPNGGGSTCGRCRFRLRQYFRGSGDSRGPQGRIRAGRRFRSSMSTESSSAVATSRSSSYESGELKELVAGSRPAKQTPSRGSANSRRCCESSSGTHRKGVRSSLRRRAAECAWLSSHSMPAAVTARLNTVCSERATGRASPCRNSKTGGTDCA